MVAYVYSKFRHCSDVECVVCPLQEFHPYVFQIFAQLIELHAANDLPAPYMTLFQPLLTPVFWERPGNVPDLTRLMQVA